VNARAFTLIELSVASLIGAIIVLATVMLLASISRNQRLVDARYQQASDLASTHAALERIFGSLVMTDQPRPPRRPPSRTPSRTGADPDEPAPIPPRFIIEPDPRLGVGGSARSITPQRVIVTIDPQAVPRTIYSTDQSTNAFEILASRDAFPPVPAYTSGAVRGVLELRPDEPRRADARQSSPNADEHAYTLWWRSLEPGQHPDDPPLEGVAPGAEGLSRALERRGAVPLLPGLVRCRWEVYQRRERKQDYTGTWMTDLPAYVMIEVQTAAGQYANWLFDVAWTEGPERGLPGSDDQANPDDPDQQGAPGAPGTAGSLPGRRAPGRARPGRRAPVRLGGDGQ